MLFVIMNVTNPLFPSKVAVCETHQEAINKLKQIGVVYYEEDETYPFCVDALGKNGQLYTIEPDEA